MIVEAQLNRVELTGILIERKAQRYTPAGIPVTEALVRHQSEQLEAGSPRNVGCELQVIGLGEVSGWIQAASLGAAMRLTGFLAAKSQNNRQLRLHINTIEFVEGN